MTHKPSIGIAICTFQAKKHLHNCLAPLIKSSLQPKILVVDSSSTDGTSELAKKLGVEVLIIPKGEFNHGKTREKARKHLNTDIIVMVTQDAYAKDEFALEKLIEPILKKQASASYGKQLPHIGAGFFETFPREFNYSSQSHIRSLKDIQKYGVYTYFFSNSFAAYNNRALDSIGGFSEVLTGEDTVAVGKLLNHGHSIAYVADACAYHSHNYSLWQEFKRHFDTGIARESYQNLIPSKGSDEKRGKEYVNQMLSKLVKENPLLLPYGLFHIVTKFLGYKLGRASTKAPTWFKKAFSSHSSYWNQ